MKALLFCLQLIISFSVFAVSEVPTIATSQLAPGNSWTWSYFEGEDRVLYSTERYTVTEHINKKVVFEIWTKYAKTSDFTPSARLTVDLNKCERAYRGQRKPFSIGMQGMVNGHWSSEIYSMHSTAFEEKFNCNPFDYPELHPLFATIKASEDTPWGIASLFQQRPKVPSQILSYYFRDHAELSGIAYKKAFNANSPYEYAMELVEYSVR
jgi:hypothetical protein